MHCFKPISKKTLASELAEADEAGDFTLLVCNVVADELREVVERDFPAARPGLESLQLTASPTLNPSLLY